jgi:Flp pilus assembly protein TadG
MPVGNRRERGAVLIHVAIAMLALLALSALSIDFGVKWVARGQAQNAADGGALAGAVGLAFDDPNDHTDTGPGKQSAWRYARANGVWGAAPNVNITTDITIQCPAGSTPACAEPCPDGSADKCIRVDVYRNQQAHPDGANPLPTFFARLVGVMDQGVRATATAKVVAGNASDCLKPWAVADKWIEHYPVNPAPWTPASEFNRYYPQGQQNGDPIVAPAVPDEYVAPTLTSPGTGFTLENDFGTEIVLKWGNPQQATSPGWFYPVQLTEPGGDEYRENIGHCAGVTWGIGDLLPVEPGAMIGPTAQGMRDLIALDPTATFNRSTKQIEHSCAGISCPGTQSPRIVAIPIFDPVAYEDGRQSGRVTIKIVNILGFFIDSLQGNDVHGFLMTTPALFNGNNGTVGNPSAFGVSIVLVR